MTAEENKTATATANAAATAADTAEVTPTAEADTATEPENDSDQAAEAAELVRELGTLRAELTLMRDELMAARLALDEPPARPTPGSLDGAPAGLYSPGEVRAMSRGEVRANLERIRESMRHWS